MYQVRKQKGIVGSLMTVVHGSVCINFYNGHATGVEDQIQCSESFKPVKNAIPPGGIFYL